MSAKVGTPAVNEALVRLTKDEWKELHHPAMAYEYEPHWLIAAVERIFAARLAPIIAAQRAAALREAAADYHTLMTRTEPGGCPEWLRERADRIEADQ